MKYMLLIFLVPVVAFAQDKPNTQKDCDQILQALSQVQISAGQAEFVAQIQKGIMIICKRAINAEQPKPASSPTLPESE